MSLKMTSFLQADVNKNIKNFLLLDRGYQMVQDFCLDIIAKIKSANSDIITIAKDESIDLLQQEIKQNNLFGNEKIIIIEYDEKKIKEYTKILNGDHDKKIIIIKYINAKKSDKLITFFSQLFNGVIIDCNLDNIASMIDLIEYFFQQKKLFIAKSSIEIIAQKLFDRDISLKNELNKIFFYLYQKEDSNIFDVIDDLIYSDDKWNINRLFTAIINKDKLSLNKELNDIESHHVDIIYIIRSLQNLLWHVINIKDVDLMKENKIILFNDTKRTIKYATSKMTLKYCLSLMESLLQSEKMIKTYFNHISILRVNLIKIIES